MLAHNISERNFRRGNKPKAVGRLKKILGKLRQITGAVGRRVPNQKRGHVLGVPKLRRVQIEHEARNGPLQFRQSTLEKNEPRTRDLGRCFEIHEPQRFPDLEVLLGFEIKRRRRAVLAHLLVVLFIGTFGHVVAWKVRKTGQRLFKLGIDAPLVLFALGDCLLKFGHF